MLDGELEQGVAAVQFQFGADVFAVAFDGADADEKQFGDFAAGALFGNQLQDAPFAGGQILNCGFLLCQHGSAIGAV